MVTKNQAILGILAAGFVAVGGIALVSPAIKNAKELKNSVQNKIKEKTKSG